jgi:hypothetical protein
VIPTCREQGKRSREESLTIEQKMTMLIRAVDDPCSLLYRGSITQEKVRGKGGGVVGAATPPLLLQAVMIEKVGQVLSSCNYCTTHTKQYNRLSA